MSSLVLAVTATEVVAAVPRILAMVPGLPRAVLLVRRAAGGSLRTNVFLDGLPLYLADGEAQVAAMALARETAEMLLAPAGGLVPFLRGQLTGAEVAILAFYGTWDELMGVFDTFDDIVCTKGERARAFFEERRPLYEGLLLRASWEGEEPQVDPAHLAGLPAMLLSVAKERDYAILAEVGGRRAILCRKPDGGEMGPLITSRREDVGEYFGELFRGALRYYDGAFQVRTAEVTKGKIEAWVGGAGKQAYTRIAEIEDGWTLCAIATPGLSEEEWAAAMPLALGD
jgi:hypothetical protein